MLNDLLTKNHKYIKHCARNICRVKNELMADDLISETFLKLTNWESIPSVDEEFVKVFVTQMKWEFKGNRSKFNKLYNGKELEIIEGYQIEDGESLNDVYLNCEQTNQATKELIDVVSHLNKSMAENYVNLVVFKESLPGWDKEIFHQYFELGMSSRDIANGLVEFAGYETNYQRINELINNVKEKIEVWKGLMK